jgi:hypothetical protein
MVSFSTIEKTTHNVAVIMGSFGKCVLKQLLWIQMPSNLQVAFGSDF